MSAIDSNRPEAQRPVVVITGPTAGGKTELAIRLAERFGGEVINADSVQVYRYMNIGTAKPSLEQRQRIPHHLLDVISPNETYDAARYAREARRVADDLLAAGKAVFLAGGTGLYIRAFLKGLLVDRGADPEFRTDLEREHERACREDDPDRLYRRLENLDPTSAARIHPRDLRRVIRALELCARSGEQASALREEHGFADCPYRALHLVIDPGREELDRRIDVRCQRMIETGLLQEVRDLRARRFGPKLRSMQTIGYRHMQPVIEGHDTLVNALEAMRRDTRRFARRQRTWWRAVPEAQWVSPDAVAEMEKAVEGFLDS